MITVDYQGHLLDVPGPGWMVRDLDGSVKWFEEKPYLCPVHDMWNQVCESLRIGIDEDYYPEWGYSLTEVTHDYRSFL